MPTCPCSRGPDLFKSNRSRVGASAGAGSGGEAVGQYRRERSRGAVRLGGRAAWWGAPVRRAVRRPASAQRVSLRSRSLVKTDGGRPAGRCAMKRAAQQQHVAAGNAPPATQPPKPFAEVLGGGASKAVAANGGRAAGGKAGGGGGQRGGRQGANAGGVAAAAEEGGGGSGGEEEEDEDDDETEQKKPGRRKISIQFIADKNKRHITFSKRKAGVLKKVPRSPSRTAAPACLAGVRERGARPQVHAMPVGADAWFQAGPVCLTVMACGGLAGQGALQPDRRAGAARGHIRNR